MEHPTATTDTPGARDGTPPEAGLRVRGLGRDFGDRTVVDDLGFRLRPGVMTGFLGSNGAGKTTSMRMIMGVLEPSRGEVLWNGVPITGADRARFGYMPEERGLYPKQRILDQLAYLGRLRGLEAPVAKEQARELLDRFGLGERTGDKLESLSLGNQQRVQIAAALLHEPECLILDEPFSGLDPVAVDSMVALLGTFLRRGVSILFSSHQLDLVERLCEDVVILEEGRLAVAGTAQELRDAGPLRYRIGSTRDAGWVREVPGVEVVDVDGPTALVDLPRGGETEGLRRELMTRGVDRGMTEFARVQPSLAEIYREAVR
ncbi:ABC transporter ATP-binding protein [Rothia santali]|uniref:ABC transporter ATP-binding protein n=1 Tax=Rothia santali TaxID=2949643 RepID=UPI0028169AD4|nr:ATP-binding cassette domain-containing protein [Rothia santali]